MHDVRPEIYKYRIAGNFRGVLIFVIFVTIPRVTKFSTHEFFHPRIFSRLLTSFAYRASGVTKFKTTKINSEDPRQLFTKICTPENYPLYGKYIYIYIYIAIYINIGKIRIIQQTREARSARQLYSRDLDFFRSRMFFE